MISILRKFRHSLISDQKVGRYLLYAAGEILLVVFGILIALQINSWSEERQHRALEVISLENLQEDLRIQEEIIQEQLAVESDAIAKVDSALLLIQDPESTPLLIRLLSDLTSRRTFIANKATFNNLGATGNIIHIQNKALQNSIIRYYQQLDYLTGVVSNNNLFLIDSQYGSILLNNRPGFRMNPDGSIQNKEDFNAEQLYMLTNLLISRQEFSTSIRDISEPHLSATQSLIAEIGSELERIR